MEKGMRQWLSDPSYEIQRIIGVSQGMRTSLELQVKLSLPLSLSLSLSLSISPPSLLVSLC